MAAATTRSGSTERGKCGRGQSNIAAMGVGQANSHDDVNIVDEKIPKRERDASNRLHRDQ